MSKSHFFFLWCFFYLVILSSCSSHENLKSKGSKPHIEKHLTATGGIEGKSGVCPKTIYDTIHPISTLNPKPKANEPLMTIEGLQQFIQRKKIKTIESLLNYFPKHYRNNFSLVEHTKALGQSNLQYPRIVLFGSDGRFLLNIGTKPDDPKYNVLDVAELHDTTGEWEFSKFDFSGKTPKLTRHDTSCIECHGSDNSRPVWGTNLEWPGVFGDNIAKGPQGEALDGKHANRMNDIMQGHGGSKRFDFLEWHHEKLNRGTKRKIAHHIFGAELLLSNIAMGTATARGAFIRLTQKKPELYKKLRKDILLLYYLKKGNALLNEDNKRYFNKLQKKLALKTMDLDHLLKYLGLDTSIAFSVATLAEKEEPKTDWSMGKGDLYDMLILQILDDLYYDNQKIQYILNNKIIDEGIIDCPDTASNIYEVIHFKMLHLFYLRGEARYMVNQYYYAIDGEDIYDRVFIPIAHNMIHYLKASLI